MFDSVRVPSASRLLVLSLIVLLAAASRLIPHPMNVTPIAALGLFAGAHFTDRRLALAIPLAALFVGDLFIGMHVLVPFVYVGMALLAALGFLLRTRRGILPVTGATVGGSVVFFLVSNFGVWLLLGTFPLTPSGLVACYVAGLPYLWNSLLGNLAFAGLFFGSFAVLERSLPALQTDTLPPLRLTTARK